MAVRLLQPVDVVKGVEPVELVLLNAWRVQPDEVADVERAIGSESLVVRGQCDADVRLHYLPINLDRVGFHTRKEAEVSIRVHDQ